MQLFIARPDQTHGPYSLEEVNRYLVTGQLSATDMAWYEGCVGWMPLSQIKGVQVPVVPTSITELCARTSSAALTATTIPITRASSHSESQ